MKGERNMEGERHRKKCTVKTSFHSFILPSFLLSFLPSFRPSVLSSFFLSSLSASLPAFLPFEGALVSAFVLFVLPSPSSFPAASSLRRREGREENSEEGRKGRT
jgi:hypothetical protein